MALALAGCVFLLLVLVLRSAMPRSDQTSAPRPGWKELCPPSFKIREPTPANPRAWKAGMMRRIGQTFTLRVGQISHAFGRVAAPRPKPSEVKRASSELRQKREEPAAPHAWRGGMMGKIGRTFKLKVGQISDAVGRMAAPRPKPREVKRASSEQRQKRELEKVSSGSRFYAATIERNRQGSVHAEPPSASSLRRSASGDAVSAQDLLDAHALAQAARPDRGHQDSARPRASAQNSQHASSTRRSSVPEPGILVRKSSASPESSAQASSTRRSSAPQPGASPESRFEATSSARRPPVPEPGILVRKSSASPESGAQDQEVRAKSKSPSSPRRTQSSSQHARRRSTSPYTPPRAPNAHSVRSSAADTHQNSLERRGSSFKPRSDADQHRRDRSPNALARSQFSGVRSQNKGKETKISSGARFYADRVRQETERCAAQRGQTASSPLAAAGAAAGTEVLGADQGDSSDELEAMLVAQNERRRRN